MWRISGLMMSLLVLTGILFVCGCSQDDAANPLVPAVVKEEPTAGNNLSFPVIWSDGYDLPLRGTFGEELWDGAYDEVDGVIVYRQQDAANQWQAESATWTTEPVNVSWIDWGDNLEARSWPARAKIRVEVALYRDLTVPMLSYAMTHIEGQGIDEMWGTNTDASFLGDQATVYTHNARLTIQKLAVAPEDPDAEFVWNPVTGEWEGDVAGTYYNSTVWENGEGPGDGYSAEINVKGMIIYGMLWDVAEAGDGVGHYRLTFSLSSFGIVPLNTLFDDATRILEPEVEDPEEGADKAEPTGGITHIDVANNLTWIDVVVVQGGGGGGGNPNRGGGGQGGPPE